MRRTRCRRRATPGHARGYRRLRSPSIGCPRSTRAAIAQTQSPRPGRRGERHSRNSFSVVKVFDADAHDLYRSTKALGKLKILPDAGADNTRDGGYRYGDAAGGGAGSQRGSGDEDSSEDDDEEDHDEIAERHAQLSQIPEGTMRRDARKLTRKGRLSLPRVTAYSTAT